jgi:predicted HTH domain antitoxin
MEYTPMQVQINLEFPEELLIAARENSDTFARRMMIYTLGHLYQQGKISSGVAAKALGCSRPQFYFLLSEHGFPVIDYPDEELEWESQTSQEIARKVQK